MKSKREPFGGLKLFQIKLPKKLKRGLFGPKNAFPLKKYVFSKKTIFHFGKLEFSEKKSHSSENDLLKYLANLFNPTCNQSLKNAGFHIFAIHANIVKFSTNKIDNFFVKVALIKSLRKKMKKLARN